MMTRCDTSEVADERAPAQLARACQAAAPSPTQFERSLGCAVWPLHALD